MPNTGDAEGRTQSLTSITSGGPPANEPSARPAVLSSQNLPEVSHTARRSYSYNANQMSEKRSIRSVKALLAPQVATLSPPVGQFLINTLLQIAGR